MAKTCHWPLPGTLGTKTIPMPDGKKVKGAKNILILGVTSGSMQKHGKLKLTIKFYVHGGLA